MKKTFLLHDRNTILITGEYDHFGNHCTRVMINNVSFLINTSPIQLLYIGFDLVAKPGNKKRCQDMIYAHEGVCFFPTKPLNEPDCIWVNPEHIVTMKAAGHKTQVELSNGYSIIIDCKITALNHKLQAANQLKTMLMTRGCKPDLQAKWDRLSRRIKKQNIY